MEHGRTIAVPFQPSSSAGRRSDRQAFPWSMRTRFFPARAAGGDRGSGERGRGTLAHVSPRCGRWRRRAGGLDGPVIRVDSGPVLRSGRTGPGGERLPRFRPPRWRALGDVQGPIPSLSRPVSGQQRPSAEAVFSRIGPKPPPRPRGRLIPAWIRWTTKGERSGEALRRELSGGGRPSSCCGRTRVGDSQSYVQAE